MLNVCIIDMLKRSVNAGLAGATGEICIPEKDPKLINYLNF